MVVSNAELNAEIAGVAVLVSHGIKVAASRSVVLRDDGSRVAILLHLVADGVDIVLTNTHITFPGEEEDCERRLREVKSLSRHMDEFVSERCVEDGCAILTGDFNGATCDPVTEVLLRSVACMTHICDIIREGYASSFECVNGRPPGATHKNHLGL
jgi:hypothetical protein